MREADSNGQLLKFVFASCYDNTRKVKDGHSIMQDIREEDPDGFVWLGDYAYVSRSERLNYLRLLRHPSELIENFPTIINSFLLSVKYKMSKLTGYESTRTFH